MKRNKNAGAGLHYVSDDSPGMHRVRHGKSFAYIDARGKPVHDKKTQARITTLVIPPAWKEVWICARPNGHLQATGRDARGRKQSRYHPKWRQTRDHDKYGHLRDFARNLPAIRRTIHRHLKLPGMPREKVLAAIVLLLETTHLRIGNDRYAHDNNHYGLTTIKNSHVAVHGTTMRFHFTGKSGKVRDVEWTDRRLAKIVAACQDLPGQQLFAYVNEEGKVCDIKSEHVNEYLAQIAGPNITAKDFRTWSGTVLAAAALREIGPCKSVTQTKRNIVQAIKQVAEQLGNTTAVCRKCCIHPAVLDGYLKGRTIETSSHRANGLLADEAAVLRLLRMT